jgi:hypothetical protein
VTLGHECVSFMALASVGYVADTHIDYSGLRRSRHFAAVFRATPRQCPATAGMGFVAAEVTRLKLKS